MQNNAAQKGLSDSQVQQLRQEIIDEMDGRISEAFRKLPAEYFREIPAEEYGQHFKALVAIEACDIRQEVMIRQREGKRITIISRENHPGLLARLIRNLPDDRPLVGAKIFSSTDRDFIVDVFDFQDTTASEESPSPAADVESVRLEAVLQQVVQLTGANETEVRPFIERYNQNHLILDSPEDLAHQYVALKETAHINDIRVLCEPDAGSWKITVSAASATTRTVLGRIANYFGLRGINIEKAVLENVLIEGSILVALLTFRVTVPRDLLKKDVVAEMEHYLRVDDEIVSLLETSFRKDLSFAEAVQRAELFLCIAKLTQHNINFCNALEISHERVLRTMQKHDRLSFEAIQLLRDRFSKVTPTPQHPNLESFTDQLQAIADPMERRTMKSLFRLVLAVERANLNTPRRRGTAFRLSGEVFENLNHGDTPFAIFYVCGQGFDGFHVRFRNVARGGMRLVPTRNTEHYLFEGARVFEEAWRLATAQQLKNKDIAEGGSKAVVVCKPDSVPVRVGRDFVDGLLDLVTDVPGTTANDLDSIDHEYLYLGPDENVTNELIDWIVHRSAERGYPYPATIMSSKPTSGINHKEFGVTSEGVLIFLRQALLEQGIDPGQQTFSVKLTGGPDGDVGGNAIRILIRDYPQTAKITGVADGTGAATDPEGLSHRELLRLVDAGLGIARFDSSQLSASGLVTGLASEQDIARRNELHNRLASDVFLPAGGRPSTINSANWQRFLDDNDKPASPIVVEGANLFITDLARDELSRCGVAIVKDSSANKCGVICSSMEIIAGMLITDQQFSSIKKEYVSEVLDLLCNLAYVESVSLFNEGRRRPDLTLPQISILISQQIIRVGDVIQTTIEAWNAEEQSLALGFVDAYLPKSLTEAAGSQYLEQIPTDYRNQLIASILSSQIVYREGCQNLDRQSDEAISLLVRKHLVNETKTRELLVQIRDSDLANKDTIAAIIEYSGSRSQRDLNL
jgi:glutamate dehydrogenase